MQLWTTSRTTERWALRYILGGILLLWKTYFLSLKSSKEYIQEKPQLQNKAYQEAQKKTDST